MRLLSVNVGQRRTQPNGNELETTGIFKIPASGAVSIAASGIVEDFIGDQKNHGGPDQAIYIYGTMDYDWWRQELHRELEPGIFGENLTVSNLESAQMHIGDRLQIGAVTLEVSAARIPCSTLAARMGDPQFVRKYRRGERPGMYCRVIAAGRVRPGEAVNLLPYRGETISVNEMFREHYRRPKNAADLRRILRAPISARARTALEADLEKALARGEA